MATISNGESGSSVRTKLNEIINKVEGVTSIDNDIDITGVLSSDGLTVDGDATIGQTTGGDRTLSIGSAGAFHFDIDTVGTTGRVYLNATNDSTAGKIHLQTTGLDRLLINNGGDISFYDDQGSSPSFFWDASNESLGIGTNTFPSNRTKLAIQGNTGASGATTNVNADEFFIDNDGDTGMTLGSSNTGTGYYAFADSDVALRAGIFYDHSTDDMGFRVSSSTRMTIDSDGNVGIGTSSPAVPLDIEHGTDNQGINVSLFSTSQSNGPALRLAHSLSNTVGTQTAVTVNDTLGKILFAGSDGSSFYDGAAIIADASQNFTDTAGGTRLEFYTTDSGTQTLDQRMIIDQDGSVGIGTELPASPLHVVSGANGNIIHANGASNAWDFILKGTNNGDSESALYELGLYRDDGSSAPNTVLKFGRGLGEQNGFFAIDQNGSEALRIDSDGDLQLSGGVYLGGVASGNKLDDYEEGNYTASLTCTTSGTITLSGATETLRYTRIGRLVHVQGQLGVASVSSPNGDLRVSLPFTVANLGDAQERGVGTVALQGIAYTGDYVVATTSASDVSYADFLQVSSGASWIGLPSNGIVAGDDIRLGFTFYTND